MPCHFGPWGLTTQGERFPWGYRDPSSSPAFPQPPGHRTAPATQGRGCCSHLELQLCLPETPISSILQTPCHQKTRYPEGASATFCYPLNKTEELVLIKLSITGRHKSQVSQPNLYLLNFRKSKRFRAAADHSSTTVLLPSLPSLVVGELGCLRE